MTSFHVGDHVEIRRGHFKDRTATIISLYQPDDEYPNGAAFLTINGTMDTQMLALGSLVLTGETQRDWAGQTE